MSRERGSHILYLSFSEFAWTALMALILIFAFSQNKAREVSLKQQQQINALNKQIVHYKSVIKQFGENGEALVAELQKYKEEVEKLTSERDEERAKNDNLQKEIEGLNSRIAALENALKDQKVQIAGLMTEKVNLEGRIQKLIDENQAWQTKYDALQAKYAALSDSFDKAGQTIKELTAKVEEGEERIKTLTGENQQWQMKYDALQAQNAVLSDSLDKAGQTIKELTAKVEEGEERIKTLTGENQEWRTKYDALQTKYKLLLESSGEARQAIEDLMAKLQEANAEIEKLNKEIARLKGANKEEIIEATQSLQEEIDKLEKEKAKLEADVNDLNTRIKKLQEQYLLISRDMIDIKGSLDRVICVVDCSSSMAYDRKWDVSRRIIKTWISNLDIRQLMLITYNDTVTRYPDTYLTVKQKSFGDPNQNLVNIIGYLDKITPQSYSDTYGALEEAYKQDPTMIVLFTDGAPNRAGKVDIDEKEMERIIKELVEKHRTVPINIIAFGNYFNRQTGNYFRRISELTNGTFIGR